MTHISEGIIDLEKVETLGHLQTILLFLKAKGWTRASVEYVIDKVWWE